MKIFLLTISFSLFSGMMSLIKKKKFFLSLLISLELVFLNLMILKFIISLYLMNTPTLCFSLFLLTLAAVDASLGMSLITLISRKFSEKSVKAISVLKK